MKLSDAVSYFGTQQKLADALNIKQGAISSWNRERIPFARALQVEKLTRGALTVDESQYVNPSKSPAQ